MPMARPELEPGSELAGFRVDRLIAAGGMGAVYLAHDATLRRRVALKVVAPTLADDERYRHRFLAEARLAASLEHPAIVPVYAAGESDDRLYLAMRFIEGGSLADRLSERRRLSASETVDLLEPIAGALDTAHAAGLVHRDMKPGNILLDGERALLADFGLAISARAESLLSAEAPHLSGTMGYVAPEQIEGDRAAPAADQYALACVAFECLTGRRPFPRDTELAVIYAHISEPPPSAADLVGELPRAVDRVLARGLAKRPDDRYPTCGELIRGIAVACGIATARTAPASRHRRLLAAAAGGAAIAAVGIGIALVSRGNDRPPAAPAAAPAQRPSDAVIRIDPTRRRSLGTINVASTPAAFAIGPHATLVVGADRAITLAPDRGQTTVVGAAPDEPVDVEYAGNAYWMTTRSETAAPFTVGDRLIRIDPTTFDLSAPLSLPGSPAGSPGLRGKQLAALGDVLWVTDPDGSVQRFDRTDEAGVVRPGVVIRKPGFIAEAVAAGDGAVWALGDRVGGDTGRAGPFVWRVNASTDDPIPVQAASAAAIAVGGGSVWVADPVDGRVHRIRPPVNSTVTVGRGVDSLSYDAGRLWAANSVTGELSIIDPATERRATAALTGRSVAVQARLSAVATAALAPAARVASLPAARVPGAAALRACSPVETASSGIPDVVVVGDFPLGTPDGDAEAAAIRATLHDNGYRANGKTVGFQVCHSETSVLFNDCRTRAKAFAAAIRVAAVIEGAGGDCLREMRPRLYTAGVALLDLAATAQDLTAPQVSYSVVFRTVGSDQAQAAGQVAALRTLHARRIFVLAAPPRAGPPNDATRGPDGADAFVGAARAAGMQITGRGELTVAGPEQVVRDVLRSGADGVFMSAPLGKETTQVLEALRARLDANVPVLIRGDLASVSDLQHLLGPSSIGLYVSSPNPAPADLTQTGRRWLQRFAWSHPGNGVPSTAISAATATQSVIQAIGRSNGTRSAVFSALLGSSVAAGITPTLKFTASNEPAAPRVAIWRITGPSDLDASVPTDFQGAQFVTSIEVPAPAATSTGSG
jgi:ABC-type branched-subunit amino acid transport system substrate-binding protein/tRNA A-37 threonylcarbamoyl transferase component Bud32